MTFSLGAKSKATLVGVHPKLVQIVELAITKTTQDFTVFEGLRSIDRQRTLVKGGQSKTMNSMHIKQVSTGFGHAVDLVPWIGGRATWDWDGCYDIAFAMDEAATELGLAINLRWGGVWDKRMSEYGGSPLAVMKEVANYRARRGGVAFVDGPHFEIYP